MAEIPGIERIRYTTSHPNEFTPRLIEAYAKIPKLVSHLHLPVQHGSDKILMAMKRGYTAMEYKSTVRKLRAIRPDMAMSCDFIVGFPGETEDDFQKMMKLIHDVALRQQLQLHLQPAPRHPGGQPARRHPARGQAAPPAGAAEPVINQNIKNISLERVGTTQRLLVEGYSKRDNGELMGRTECNRVVNFPGQPAPDRPVGRRDASPRP